MDYTDIINSKKVVLIEFFATWCPHCAHMMPIVAQIKELLQGQVLICQIDIDKNSDLADNLNVQGVPTFIIYKDGEEVWRQNGEMEAQELLENIQRFI